MFKLVGADNDEAQAKLVDECIALLEKEIEPLLADASPYFGGSDRITIVEVRSDLDPSTSAWLPKFSSLSPFLFLAQFTPSTSTYMPQTPSILQTVTHLTHSLTPLVRVQQAMTTPFTLRLHDFANGQIFPTSLAERMTASPTLPNFGRWVKRCMAHPSVTYVWDKEYYLPRIVERLPQAKAKYASK